MDFNNFPSAFTVWTCSDPFDGVTGSLIPADLVGSSTDSGASDAFTFDLTILFFIAILIIYAAFFNFNIEAAYKYTVQSVETFFR